MNYDELTAVDANLENWKAWGQVFTDELLLIEISQETIDGIELFDAGELVQMPLKSSKGIIPSGSMEAKGLALTRWLIEHNTNERTSRFRENEKRLTEILLTLNQIETSGDVLKAQKFTPKRKHGSKSIKTLYIEKLYSDNPGLAAKELFKLADCKILGSMALTTFANHVTAARKIKK